MYSHFCKRAVRARSVNSFDSKSALNARAKEAKFVSSMSNTPKKKKRQKVFFRPFRARNARISLRACCMKSV